jgi:hypothetical protein
MHAWANTHSRQKSSSSEGVWVPFWSAIDTALLAFVDWPDRAFVEAFAVWEKKALSKAGRCELSGKPSLDGPHHT